MMISGPSKVAMLLLAVAVFGEVLDKDTEDEGESLPEIETWARAHQEAMPLKGQKMKDQKMAVPTQKPKNSVVPEKKQPEEVFYDFMNLRFGDDDDSLEMQEKMRQEKDCNFIGCDEDPSKQEIFNLMELQFHDDADEQTVAQPEEGSPLMDLDFEEEADVDDADADAAQKLLEFEAKKQEVFNLMHLMFEEEEDDADDVDAKRGAQAASPYKDARAPAPAPLLQDFGLPLGDLELGGLEASKEDDGDAPHKQHGRKDPFDLWHMDIFAETMKEYQHMSEEEFADLAVRETKPLMDHLYEMLDNQQKAMKEQADKDPMTKWYLKVFEPYQFAEMYPEEAEKKEEEKKVKEEDDKNFEPLEEAVNSLGEREEKKEEEKKVKEEDYKNFKPLEEAVNSLGEEEEKEEEQGLQENSGNEEEQEAAKAKEELNSALVDMELLHINPDSEEAKNAFVQLEKEFQESLEKGKKEEATGEDESTKGIDKKKGAYLGGTAHAEEHLEDKDAPVVTSPELEANMPKSEESEDDTKTEESEDDIEAAHKELIKHESAQEQEVPDPPQQKEDAEVEADLERESAQQDAEMEAKVKELEANFQANYPESTKQEQQASTVRSNVAVRVDSNGNMVQMSEEEPAKELGQKKSVRQAADDTDSKERRASISSRDADETPHTTATPHNVFDAAYKSPEDKQREAETTKRRAYLSIGGGVILIIFVGWLFIRHRAQQMIERSTAFDDASSVSSSTVTEENPTVKVNRALLERMANISQKLSEKVEEARASSNADSNSSGGSRGYTRKKPLLGAQA